METAAKAESLQAQRTILDLRAEIQGLQRDLGTARAAQAKLEGELREAQRRMMETERTAEARRGELTRTREERDRLAQAGFALQGQLVELGQLRQQAAEAGRDQTRLQALETAIERQTKEMAELKAMLQRISAPPKPKPSGAGPPGATSKGTPGRTTVASEFAVPVLRTVTVERGDTLWALARKYRVSLAELKALNNLATDLIVPGQELVLPDSPSG